MIRTDAPDFVAVNALTSTETACDGASRLGRKSKEAPSFQRTEIIKENFQY
jgi:hypothetical protein